MLKRAVALSFLQSVLWSMMQATQTQAGHTKDQCHGIILDIEPLLDTNKIQAIKDLRDWINNTHKIVLPNNLGAVIRDAMMVQGNLYSLGANELMFQNEHRFGLKEAKDFIDVMGVVLHATEAKTF